MMLLNPVSASECLQRSISVSHSEGNETSKQTEAQDVLDASWINDVHRFWAELLVWTRFPCTVTHEITIKHKNKQSLITNENASMLLYFILSAIISRSTAKIFFFSWCKINGVKLKNKVMEKKKRNTLTKYEVDRLKLCFLVKITPIICVLQ